MRQKLHLVIRPFRSRSKQCDRPTLTHSQWCILSIMERFHIVLVLKTKIQFSIFNFLFRKKCTKKSNAAIGTPTIEQNWSTCCYGKLASISIKKLYQNRHHKTFLVSFRIFIYFHKAELLQLNRTQSYSLGIFVSKKVGNRKNKDHLIYNF